MTPFQFKLATLKQNTLELLAASSRVLSLTEYGNQSIWLIFSGIKDHQGLLQAMDF